MVFCLIACGSKGKTSVIMEIKNQSIVDFYKSMVDSTNALLPVKLNPNTVLTTVNYVDSNNVYVYTYIIGNAENPFSSAKLVEMRNSTILTLSRLSNSMMARMSYYGTRLRYNYLSENGRLLGYFYVFPQEY